MSYSLQHAARPACPICRRPGTLGGIGACTWSHFRAALRGTRLRVLVYELGAGREVVDLLAPLAELPPVRLPSGPPIPCAHCHGQRRILEPGPLGYIAVVCGRCHGAGMDPA